MSRSIVVRYLGFGALALVSAITAPAAFGGDASLLVNGDFESGNIGFFTEYTYSPGYINPHGSYDVLSDPADAHNHAVSYGDHTSGSGFMMAVNGAVDGRTVWSQTIPVNPNRDHVLSGWVSTWSDFDPPAELQFLFNEIPIGTVTAPVTTGIWEEFSFVWHSGATEAATIRIVDLKLDILGNDFSLDDLSFAGIPCGNGNLDSGEECDDGNNLDGDGCAADCILEAPVPAVSPRGVIALVLLLLASSVIVFARRRVTGV
jgi:cysteine-rich repeat protein